MVISEEQRRSNEALKERLLRKRAFREAGPVERPLAQLAATERKIAEDSSKNNKFFLAYSQIETCQKKDIEYVLTKYKTIINNKSYLNPTCSAHHTYNIAVNNYEKIKEFI